VARHPVSAHQRNLRHLAVIARCQILFSGILLVLHNFKSVPEGSVWFQRTPSGPKLPIRQFA
jgi:hypothetical protein